MGYLPLNYEQINLHAGTYFPSQVKPYNNEAFKFWQRSLFQRACSTLIINTPKEWERHKNLLYWSLFAYGFCGVFNIEEFGKCFNPCTISGYNFYYEPTTIILANPAMSAGEKQEFKIGKDAELLKLTPDYQGIFDIITYYAEKLASMDCSINSAIVNTKFAYIMGAKNKAAAEVLKKLFDKVSKGEPAVFFDSKLANDPNTKEEPWQALFRDNLKQSYLITDLLKDFQTILNNFDCEIGIPTIPYEKKERMVTSEAESRTIDATARNIIWFDELSRTMEIANKFLGFTGSDRLSVVLRYNDENQEGGKEDGNSEDNINRVQ
ncbi:MAG: hypothetical protein J6T10_11480 [Methanobrevibacter sp.]|nr:hypothetical protein [Methanobrevibacter sp.]